MIRGRGDWCCTVLGWGRYPDCQWFLDTRRGRRALWRWAEYHVAAGHAVHVELSTEGG